MTDRIGPPGRATSLRYLVSVLGLLAALGTIATPPAYGASVCDISANNMSVRQIEEALTKSCHDGDIINVSWETQDEETISFHDNEARLPTCVSGPQK